MITETPTNKHADWSAYDPVQDATTPQPLQTIVLKVVTLAERAYQLDETKARDENDPFGWMTVRELMARGNSERLARKQLAAFIDNLPDERRCQLCALMAFGRSKATDLAQFYREAAAHLGDDDATARKHQGVSLERTENLAYNLYVGLKRADDLGLDLEPLLPTPGNG